MGRADHMVGRGVAASSVATRCPGCGVELPAGNAVYEGYYNTSPECWSQFCEVIGREFQSAALFGAVHQLTVDAYAAQHAGGAHPDKSVCVHLVGLHLVLERGVSPTDVPPLLQRLAGATREWPHFEPPAERVVLTAHDLAQAVEPAQHIELARAWSRSVWLAWSAHHAAVAQLARRCFEARSASA